MVAPIDPTSLHPLEDAVLRALAGGFDAVAETDIAAVTGLDAASVRRGIELLKARGGVDLAGEETESFVSLTEEGEALARDGVVELRILDETTREPATVPELVGRLELEQRVVGTAAGQLKKAGAVSMDDGRIRPVEGADRSAWEGLTEVLQELSNRRECPLHLFPHHQEIIEAGHRKRGGGGIFRIREWKRRRYKLTDAGREIAAALAAGGARKAVSQLTPAMLRDGSWRKATFRRYNLTLPPPRIVFGRKHPYRAFLDHVKDRLTRLGFSEMTGPLVESEFWNMDALFMPQTHPARQIHDVYRVKSGPAPDLPDDVVDRVAAAHRHGGGTGSRGWGYDFSGEATRRRVLRSQGTALSSRWLAGAAEVPGKYFSIARCFRADTVDATHAPDFFQIEGIVTGRSIHLGHLMGLLELFGRELARAEDVSFRPTYFPFTEPSVEVAMKHPDLGWIELGGAGIFRPEVVRPLRPGWEDVQVIAWGLGLDRMAMVALGVTDIRQLFAGDLAWIRGVRGDF